MVEQGGDGAAPESNRPSRGLHDRTSFEDPLGHRAHAAPTRRLAPLPRPREPRYARAHGSVGLVALVMLREHSEDWAAVYPTTWGKR
jgi:hypothetical protein